MPRAKKAATVAPEDIEETSAPQLVSPSAIQTIAFSRLRRAPENVRQTDIAADVDSLASDIAAHGLLQSLIGYVWNKRVPDTSVIYIVGGGRRLQALTLLHERGQIPDDFAVPVLLRPKDEAIELSLSENLARRDMNAADEFVAFQELMKPGTLSVNDLAKRFGFSERYVKQRLRFAGLHPDILNALREGAISLEFATEYAKTTDQQLQFDVYRAMQRGPVYNRNSFFALRSALNSKQLTEDDAIFRFIDRATYEAEGGGYIEDLFAEMEEGQGRRLDKGQLAREIASRCLAFQADPVVLSTARRRHPSVAGYVLAPELVAGGGRPNAPSGCVLIEGGWNSTLSTHVNITECWKRADAIAAPIHIIVGIAQESPNEKDDDDSELAYVSAYEEARFFVPRDVAKQVLPPKHQTNYGGPQLTPEEQREKEIEREAKLWAARLAGPSFKDTPFEGQVFYGDYWLRTNERRPGDPYDAPRLTAYDLRVFVTDEQIAANMEAGRKRAIAEREAAENARAAKLAAQEAAAAEKAKAFADKLAEIQALETPPAVIMVTTFEGGDFTPWFRWKSGDYFDLSEDDPDASTAEGVESVEELADVVAEIGEHYPTVAAYHAAIAAPSPEEMDEAA